MIEWAGSCTALTESDLKSVDRGKRGLVGQGTSWELVCYVGLAIVVLVMVTLFFSEKQFDRLFGEIASAQISLDFSRSTRTTKRSVVRGMRLVDRPENRQCSARANRRYSNCW
jgi:hypothetical protein